jgi:hypothetical protein
MVWFVVMEIFSTLLEWVRLGRKSESEKTLEILLLRRQLAIVERTLDKPIRPSRGEKLTLAVLTTKLKARTGRTTKELGEIIRVVQPETILKWHRELVRQKWTNKRKTAAVDYAPHGRSSTWFCAWHARTTGAMARSKANWCFIRECKLIQSEHYKVPRDHTYWWTHTKTRAQKWLDVANFEGVFPLISTPRNYLTACGVVSHPAAWATLLKTT